MERGNERNLNPRGEKYIPVCVRVIQQQKTLTIEHWAFSVWHGNTIIISYHFEV